CSPDVKLRAGHAHGWLSRQYRAGRSRRPQSGSEPVRADLLILESDPSGQAALAEYCAGRGFRPRAVTDFLQFAAAWQPGLKLICLSLPLASTDGIEAIRFLAEHRCEAGLVLTSDADPRVLSAASR